MADRHSHAALRQPADQLQRAGQLRSDRDHATVLDKRGERLARHLGRQLQKRRIVRPAFRRCQEGALEVEAKRLRAVVGGSRCPCAYLVRELGKAVNRCRDGGRQKGRHAAAQEGAGHAVERGPIAHGVVATPAMNVDVDKTGDDQGRVLRESGIRIYPGDHPALDGYDPRDNRVVEHQPTANRLAHAPAAISAPCTAAPIAPAHTPNCAGTIATESRDVT